MVLFFAVCSISPRSVNQDSSASTQTGPADPDADKDGTVDKSDYLNVSVAVEGTDDGDDIVNADDLSDGALTVSGVVDGSI